MATPIRENCLNAEDRPNALGHLIHRAIQARHMCPHIMKRGKNKGKPCGRYLTFHPAFAEVSCRFHRFEAYGEEFGDLVLGWINKAENGTLVAEGEFKEQIQKVIDERK